MSDTPKTDAQPRMWENRNMLASYESVPADFARKLERENTKLREALQASTGNLILWEKSDPIGTAHFLPERIAANEHILSNDQGHQSHAEGEHGIK